MNDDLSVLGTTARSWQPGEHVAVIGQTGTGKTHLIDRLIRANRRYVVVFKTKHDAEDDGKYWQGFTRITKARDIDNPRHTRFLLAPPLGKFPQQYDAQVREGLDLIARVFKQGGWTVVFDERWYCERMLKLTDGIEMLETQGRSKGISVVSGAQRPVEISRFALSQATHVFAFAGDRRDADTIGRSTSVKMRPVVEALREHDFAYWHQRTQTIMTGNSRRLSRVVSQALATAARAVGQSEV